MKCSSSLLYFFIWVFGLPISFITSKIAFRMIPARLSKEIRTRYYVLHTVLGLILISYVSYHHRYAEGEAMTSPCSVTRDPAPPPRMVFLLFFFLSRDEADLGVRRACRITLIGTTLTTWVLLVKISKRPHRLLQGDRKRTSTCFLFAHTNALQERKHRHLCRSVLAKYNA